MNKQTFWTQGDYGGISAPAGVYCGSLAIITGASAVPGHGLELTLPRRLCGDPYFSVLSAVQVGKFIVLITLLPGIETCALPLVSESTARAPPILFTPLLRQRFQLPARRRP